LVLVYSRVLASLKARHWRLLSVFSAVSLIALIGFTRIALGAHFLTDVLAAILPSFLELSGSRLLFATKPMRQRMVSPAGVPLISEPALVGVESAEKPAQSLPS